MVGLTVKLKLTSQNCDSRMLPDLGQPEE